VCTQISVLNFGVMMVYWIDFGMSGIPSSAAWRVPTIIQVAFLILQIVLLFFVPDTARWYASRDRPDEALMVLQRLYKGRMPEEDILRLHQDIIQTAAMESSLGAGNWSHLLKNDAIKSRRRLFLSCGIQIMEQLGGNNAVLCKLSMNTIPILMMF
jgi:uncharacterized membrane protein